MKKAFVVSDIHGMYDRFETILSFWDRKDKLVILGDMVDRGPDSKEVIEKVMDLQRMYDVTVLKGNHEDMMVKALSNPLKHYQLWAMNGGDETIRSFLGDKAFWTSEKQRVIDLQVKYLREVSFLESLSTSCIFGKVLFTHAGFNSAYTDLEKTSDEDLIWVRNHFLAENKTGLINVFGHTPTISIRSIVDDATLINDIWVSECKSYIGIDGAAAYGGQLNAMQITEEGKVINKFHV